MKVNFEIQNIQSSSISYGINKLAIVTNKGEQYGMVRAIASFGGSITPPKDCSDSYDLGALKPNSLFPNAKEQFTICFESFTKEDEPMFYIGVISDAEVEQGYDIFNFKVIGNKREHSFDLTSMIEWFQINHIILLPILCIRK